MKAKKINTSRLVFPSIVMIVCVASVVQTIQGQPPMFSTSEVYRISDNTVVANAGSTLLRNRRGIATTIRTSGLAPGAYSVWWIVHNYPEYCTERPCTLTDEENPLVQASVLNATGSVIGPRGIGNFAASLGVGGPYRGEVLFGPGLVNPLGADVLLVVRYHGPVIPEILTEQLTTYDGGCSINACSDEQIALHLQL